MQVVYIVHHKVLMKMRRWSLLVKETLLALVLTETCKVHHEAAPTHFHGRTI